MMLPAMLVICRARGNTFRSHIICRINLASVHVNSSRRSRWRESLRRKHSFTTKANVGGEELN